MKDYFSDKAITFMRVGGSFFYLNVIIIHINQLPDVVLVKCMSMIRS